MDSKASVSQTEDYGELGEATEVKKAKSQGSSVEIREGRGGDGPNTLRTNPSAPAVRYVCNLHFQSSSSPTCC